MKKILIIDDDPNNIFALTAVLSSRGFSVKGAGGMQQAFQLLRSDGSFGIILMDMMMPGIDGYDAMPLLRSDDCCRHIPVIAVTAQAMPGDKEKCLAAGAADYISKPVDTDRLLTILNKYLNGK